MAKQSIIARPIEPSETEAYSALAKAHGSLFDRKEWASFHGGDLTRIGLFDSSSHLRGGFCVMRARRFGFTVLRVPPFTPSIGPFFEPRASNPVSRANEVRDVMEAMASFVDDSGAAVIVLSLSPETKDLLPFYWRKFKVVPRYTYRIHLRVPESTILASMSPERRHAITKAQRDGIETAVIEDVGEMRAIIEASLSRNRFSQFGPLIDRLLARFPPGPNSFGILATAAGRVLAGTYILHDERTAYYIIGGYEDKENHHGAGPLAMYRSILRSREMGLACFDFEGSMVPSIERYFRGFGGTLTPYFSINKAWLPLEFGLKLIKRSHF